MKNHKLRFFTFAILLMCLKSTFAQVDHHVSAFYYPWYDVERLPGGGHLRAKLIPKQYPVLGEYKSHDTLVVAQQLQWSQTYGIDNWWCSWWGIPGMPIGDPNVDTVIQQVIAPLIHSTNMTYSIFYETPFLLPTQNFNDSLTRVLFRTQMNYLADTYFEDPSYFRIDNRPAIAFYACSFEGPVQAMFDLVRQDIRTNHNGMEIFMISEELNVLDSVQWQSSFDTTTINRMAAFDGITMYLPYSKSFYGYFESTEAIRALDSSLTRYGEIADSLGILLIPTATPGFNAKGQDLNPAYTDSCVMPRRVAPDSSHTSSFCRVIDVAKKYVEPTYKYINITSFNEWHEDSQVEPVLVTVDSTNQDSSGNSDYTQGFYYKGYGFDCLEVIRTKLSTLPPVGISPFVDDPGTTVWIYPNPMVKTAYVELELIAKSQVSIGLTDLRGQVVQVIAEDMLSKGRHRFTWQAGDLPMGTYLLNTIVDGNTYSKKIIIYR